MFTKTLLITPEMAKEMLERNTKNRPIQSRRVTLYARDMSAGKWLQSGETIKFSVGGKLLDGQHRLHAIVKSNKPISTICVYDLEDEVFEVVDTGKNRGAWDMLAIMGYKNLHSLAATANLQITYDRDTFNGVSGGGASLKITNMEIHESILAHPYLPDAVNKAANFMSRRFGYGSLQAFFYYNFGRINKDGAEDFFMILSGKLQESADYPVVMLRERLLSNSLSTIAKLSKPVVAGMFIKAWNAHITGKKIGILRMSDKEEMPVFE